MSKIVTYLIAIAITYPIIVTIIVYLALRYIYKNKKLAIHKCMEYTAIFHLLSVIVISRVILDIQIIGPVLIFLLILFLIFILIQWTMIRDIKIKRLRKLYLRLVFLLSFFVNILLMIISIYTLI